MVFYDISLALNGKICHWNRSYMPHEQVELAPYTQKYAQYWAHIPQPLPTKHQKQEEFYQLCQSSSK